MAAQHNFIEMPAGRLVIDAAEETLAANRTITLADPLELWLDPGGSARDVTLPAEANAEGAVYRIFNVADASENLVVKDDGGSTIVTIARQRGAVVKCSSAAWATVGEFLVTSAT